MFYFLRPLIQRIRYRLRHRVRLMSRDEMEEKRQFFAKLYMFSAISACVWATYITGKNGLDFYPKDDPRPLYEKTIEGLNVKKDVRVIRYVGFNKVEDFIYKRENPETTQ